MPAGSGIAATAAVGLLRQYAAMQENRPTQQAPDAEYIRFVAEQLVEDWKALEAQRDRARRLATGYLSEMWQAQSLAREIQERVSAL